MSRGVAPCILTCTPSAGDRAFNHRSRTELLCAISEAREATPRFAERRPEPYCWGMSSFPLFLGVLILGFVLSTILLVVAVVKTVRYHGWGKRTWAPPAVPWFITAMVVLVLTLAVGFLLM
jgi:hypothetical protein